MSYSYSKRKQVRVTGEIEHPIPEHKLECQRTRQSHGAAAVPRLSYPTSHATQSNQIRMIDPYGQTTTPAPQPSTSALDQVIATILSTVSMAVSALHLVPGMPVQVLAIVQTAIGDLQAAYTAYRANPTASAVRSDQHDPHHSIGRRQSSSSPVISSRYLTR